MSVKPSYEELSATVNKLLSQDIFGLDKYGIPIDGTHQVQKSEETNHFGLQPYGRDAG